MSMFYFSCCNRRIIHLIQSKESSLSGRTPRSKIYAAIIVGSWESEDTDTLMHPQPIHPPNHDFSSMLQTPWVRKEKREEPLYPFFYQRQHSPSSSTTTGKQTPHHPNPIHPSHGNSLALLNRRRRRRHIKPCVLRHHALEPDAHALDDGEQDGAADGAVTDRLCAAADGQGAAGEEAGDDSVPGVFLLTVERRGLLLVLIICCRGVMGGEVCEKARTGCL